jgi:hypothetical protein
MIMGPMIIGSIVVGSVCFAVALLHGFSFFRRPDLRADLWFALMALSVAGNALTEQWVYPPRRSTHLTWRSRHRSHANSCSGSV